jgi:acyl carrier protein
MVSDQIHTIWKRELKYDDFTNDDDFFDLGGHSLIMARIQSALLEEFGTEVPMDELMRHSTVNLVSAHIEKSAAVK